MAGNRHPISGIVRDAGGYSIAPIAVTFATGKKLSGLGLTTLWKLASEGRIELVRVGRRTLITYRSLQALLTPQVGPEPTPRRSTPARRPKGRSA